MSYQFTELKEELTIRRIVSIHYFEYMSDFSFEGEAHNFWEFLYVDRGELLVTAGKEQFSLHQGQIIFHKPGEFHALSANHVVAPTLVVISFEALAPCMSFFEHKILTVGEQERNLLARLLSEARDTFEGPLDDPYMECLTRKADAPFASEQIIKLSLEYFLLRLFRDFAVSHVFREPAPPGGSTAFADILAYLEDHLGQQLTIEQISRDNLISVSQLKKLFRTYHGGGVMDAFNTMKINAAKQMIRDRQMNFTQIADALGYTSIHYFSRQFKKMTSMTPTQYRDSLLLRARRPGRRHFL